MKKRALKCQRFSVKNLPAATIAEMYKLFEQYYQGTSFDTFVSDLKQKDYVFIIFQQKNNIIKGFSSIVVKEFDFDGRPARVAFSGDTVIDREYWGQRVLGTEFLKFLFILKLQKLNTPLYWFLISKGYKTYLLMANNFDEYYPRYEVKTPDKFMTIIDRFGNDFFGEKYDQKNGVVLSKDKDRLREVIAPISDDLLETNPRVKFFQDKNPHWSEGNELACVARMTLLMPLKYQLKKSRNQTLVPFAGSLFDSLRTWSEDV